MASVQRDGSAVTAVSTNNNKAVIKSPSTSTNEVRTSHWSIPMEEPSIKGGVNLGQAEFGSYTQATYTGGVSGIGGTTGITNAPSPYSGLVRLNIGDHSFTTGNVVGVKYNPESLTGVYNGHFRVIATIGTSGVVLNKAYVSNVTGILYASPVSTVGYMAAGNYTMKRLQSTTHGTTNNTMASAAADHGQRGHGNFLEAVRTVRVTDAIRSGAYDIFSGRFTTHPSVSNDFSGFGTDHATQTDSEGRALLAEIAFNYGAPNPSGAYLEAKTG